jgi:hypothetical protein
MTILEAIQTCRNNDGWMARPHFRDWIRPSWNHHDFVDEDGKLTERLDLDDITEDDWMISLTANTPPYMLAEVPGP